MNKGRLAFGALAVVTLCVLGTMAVTARSVPDLINYQGRISGPDGTPPADGSTVDLAFSFYGTLTGDSVLYLRVLQKNVVVNGGFYSVLIGSGIITPGIEMTLPAVFQKHSEVWMGVKVDSDPEMTPRALITSAPYAMKVDTAWLTAFINTPDFDGDGYEKGPGPLGTVDCDDGDIMINPDAFDFTADGFDQNCDGVDGLLPEGHSCNFGYECASDSCVDGYCCDTNCTGSCMACDLSGIIGTCANIPYGQDPDSECAGATSCNGSGVCTLLPNGSTCLTAGECQSNNCVDGYCCNTSCAELCQACDISGFIGTCSNILPGMDPDNECPLLGCNGTGGCALLGPGDYCFSGDYCWKGWCVDSVCCSTSCTGLCQACDISGLGQCTNIPYGTDPDNECPGASNCDGAGACTP